MPCALNLSTPRRWLCALALLWSVVLLAPEARAVASAAGREDVVKEVRVERRGGGVVEAGSVLAYVSIKAGEELSRNALARDVKSLDKSGRFSYVESRVDRVPGGYVLVFVVEPKLRIRKLKIVGADELGNHKVQDLLELAPGDIADDATIAAHTVKVVDKYNKKYYF